MTSNNCCNVLHFRLLSNDGQIPTYEFNYSKPQAKALNKRGIFFLQIIEITSNRGVRLFCFDWEVLLNYVCFIWLILDLSC